MVKSITPSGLTQRQENFARRFAECGVAIEAYASAYDVGSNTNRHTTRVNAYRLLRHPAVTARVRQLQEAANEHSLRSTASLIRELEDMTEADINELLSLSVGACRHCWGEAGGYQWRDDLEYAKAADAAIAAGKPLPDLSGGLGYKYDREPNSECPECDGTGVNRVRFTNTADVSPGARRLFKGIEMYPDGNVKKLLLHDQMAARIELHKLRGMHVDRSLNITAHMNVPTLKDMSHEQALDFLDSLKPAQ
jgi:phage terminase small subunit